MKTITLLMSVLFAGQAYAHCPNEFEGHRATYCAEVEWQNASKRQGGAFVELNELSPVLNKKGTKSFQWVYSNALLKVWKKGDADHKQQFPDELKVSTYMKMLNHMSHPGASEVSLTEEGYLISQAAFQEMKGCWYIKVASMHETALIEVSNFTNLNPDELIDVATFCSICSGIEDTDSHGDHGDHTEHH